MTDIVAFITARLDEDVRLAEEAAADAGSATAPEPDWTDGGGIVLANGVIAYGLQNMEMDASVATHIARHDPARVLAEFAAKRRAVKRHEHCDTSYGWCGDGGHSFERAEGGCFDLLDLAAPYADHPDYDQAWMVEA